MLRKEFDRIFGGIDLMWLKVIIFAAASGVVTGIIMALPLPEFISFRNIGTCFEMWICLAIAVISNCRKPVEAGLKTFVFFLVSQPLVYLVQVPFSRLGFGLFSYYPQWCS